MEKPQEVSDIEWLIGILKNIKWACEDGIDLNCGPRDPDQVARRCQQMIGGLMRQHRHEAGDILDSRRAGRKVAFYVVDDANDHESVARTLNRQFFDELFGSTLNKKTRRHPSYLLSS